MDGAKETVSNICLYRDSTPDRSMSELEKKESSDPRKKDLPPRPSGQRPEPDRRGTGAFGNPFGNGNFQFSFGIGGFPFGFIGAVGGHGANPFGFGQAHAPVSIYDS